VRPDDPHRAPLVDIDELHRAKELTGSRRLRSHCDKTVAAHALESLQNRIKPTEWTTCVANPPMSSRGCRDPDVEGVKEQAGEGDIPGTTRVVARGRDGI
jgi:hypothetical protein